MMRNKEIQFEADEVNIDVLWKALSKDKIEFIFKAFPGLLTDTRILEGDPKSVGLGSVLLFYFGPAASHLPPFVERIVECDKTKHVVSFLGIEGGYLKIGFTHYFVSFKLDDMGNRKTSIMVTMNYDFEKGFDETKLLEALTFGICNYINNLVGYLKKTSASEAI